MFFVLKLINFCNSSILSSVGFLVSSLTMHLLSQSVLLQSSQLNSALLNNYDLRILLNTLAVIVFVLPTSSSEKLRESSINATEGRKLTISLL